MSAKSIYLHIFDREFRSFTYSKLSDEVACETVALASLLSSSPYAGMANLMESQPDLPKAVELFYELENAGEATIVSSSIYPDDFIEGRKKLYYDDKDRYPMYFENNTCLLLPKNAVPLQNSTTTILEERLTTALREENVPRNIQNAKEIKKAILGREESGITIGLIGRHTSLTPVERRWLGEQISKAYTERYMNVLDGCLIKSIPNVSIALDDLSEGYCYFSLYNRFFKDIVFRHIDWNKGAKYVVDYLLKLKSQYSYWELVDYYNDIICSMFDNYTNKDTPCNERFIAVRCHNILKQHLFPMLTEPKEFNVLQSLSILRKSAMNIFEKEKITITMNQENTIKKVLYLVAAEIEYDNVFEYYKSKNNCAPDNVKIGDYVYRDLNLIGNAHVYLLKSNMGSKGNGGSIIVVNDAVKSLKPDYIIMLGIGFGLKEDKQNFGDIMVSSAIEDYGTCKITNGKVIQRGNRISPNNILMNRFANSRLEWKKSKVHTGLIVTNDILVNDLEYVSFLKQQFPDAIGGEMEGCGLLANYTTPWILVKAICDYGHNKGDGPQADAVQNAIRFVDFTLERYPL